MPAYAAVDAPPMPGRRDSEEDAMSSAAWQTGRSTGRSDEQDGRHDFDFLHGTFRVRNRRLKERLRGSTEWLEFEATNASRELLGGLGIEDEYRTEFWPGFVGMAFRFFDPVARRWAIYWADSNRGLLEPPVYGGFADGAGVFEGDDVFEGRPIRVRFLWTGVASQTPRWEQAFSTDGGATWETNWIMDFEREDAARGLR